MVRIAADRRAGAGGIAGHAPGPGRVIGPQASDFSVRESCAADNGCAGTYTVVNNSPGYYVYSFKVANPHPFNASTTQNNWSAEAGDNACDVAETSCGNGFSYGNDNGDLQDADDLANDVGPGQTSANFFFNALFPASKVTLDLTDGTNDYTLPFPASDVPEPASLALPGSGLVWLAGSRRRRRAA